LFIGTCQGAGVQNEVVDEKYITPGYYKVVSANLAYDTVIETVKDRTRQYVFKPRNFELKLEGKAGDSDAKVIRYVVVPFERVEDNYKIAPFVAQKPESGSSVKKIPLTLSKFAIKQKGDWWKFRDSLPEK